MSPCHKPTDYHTNNIHTKPNPKKTILNLNTTHFNLALLPSLKQLRFFISNMSSIIRHTFVNASMRKQTHHKRCTHKKTSHDLANIVKNESCLFHNKQETKTMKANAKEWLISISHHNQLSKLLSYSTFDNW